LAGVVDKFHYVKFAVALILIFVGSKMTWLTHLMGKELSMGWSLGVIGAFLAGGVFMSIVSKTERQ